MTDTQLLTLVLAILGIIVAIVTPLTALLYSNSRITEAKETLRADIKALQGHTDAEIAVLCSHVDQESATLRGEMVALRAQMAALQTNIEAGFERLHNALKIHELEHHK